MTLPFPQPRLTGVLVLLLSLLLPGVTRADGLTDILERKVVRIGVCEFAPWTFKNKAGQLTGFEIAVGRQIAHDLGVKPEFKVYTLEAAFDAVDRGEIDFIAAGLAITPARALRVEFTMPYFESGATIVINRTLSPDVKEVEDLNKQGVVVLHVSGTFSSSLAKQLFDATEIKSVPDARAAERELLAGRAQAYLTSLPEAVILARRNPALGEIHPGKPLAKSVAGLALKRGNYGLLHFLNAWVVARWADNLLPSLNSYWFNEEERAFREGDGLTAP